VRKQSVLDLGRRDLQAFILEQLLRWHVNIGVFTPTLLPIYSPSVDRQRRIFRLS
jgi:hypothetical protein